MRIACTLNDQIKATALSAYLASKKIENQCEIITNLDWGSADYGTVTCKIWIIDEDQFEPAQHYVNEFLENPYDPKYSHPTKKLPPITIPRESPKPRVALSKKGKKNIAVTLFFLVGCTLLFMFSQMTKPNIQSIPAAFPYAPFLTPPINKALLYDWPKAYSILDTLVKTFGVEKVQKPSELPLEGKYFLEKFYETPYWQGYYGAIVDYFHLGTPLNKSSAPMFEKIREGEIWRLFSPALLHSDIFHILFNMLWLIVLGRQMEERLSKGRYILFIIATGIITNTAQYLMSGPNFIGFSGILCAMITFVWTRQKKAPWESYNLDKSTMAFIMLFLCSVLLFQIISFALETSGYATISPGIANTAHFTGLASGLVLGRLNYFKS